MGRGGLFTLLVESEPCNYLSYAKKILIESLNYRCGPREVTRENNSDIITKDIETFQIRNKIKKLKFLPWKI